jgi:hypothetical protein
LKIVVQTLADIQRDGTILLVVLPTMLHLIIAFMLHHGMGRGGEAEKDQ